MKINGKTINAKEFAFDESHKIYIIENKEQLEKHIELGYNILDISKLEETFKNAGELRFIRTGDLESIVEQFESANFEYEESQYENTNNDIEIE